MNCTVCLFFFFFKGHTEINPIKLVWQLAPVLSVQTHCTIRLYIALSPYTVQNIPVFGDPQKLVVSGNLMEISSLFIGKEQIGFPNGVQHGGIKVKGVIGIFAVGQPRVIPLLSQENVHSVILWRTKTAMSTDQRWGRDTSTFYKLTSGSGTCEVSQRHAFFLIVCLNLVQVNLASSHYIFCLR